MRRLIFSLFLLALPLLLQGGNFAVVTIAAGDAYKESVKIGTESKQTYCALHGYDFIFSDQSEDPSRHIYWSKILLMLKALENSANEWVVWLDADTLIMNQGIRLEDLIDDRYNMLIAKDRNGLNAGVFFLRNCDWSREFLRRVYCRADCISHQFPEQTAMVKVLESDEKFRLKTKFVPQRLFNSYASEVQRHYGITPHLKATYQKGDFLLHFAGANKPLSQLFNTYGQQCINNKDLFDLDFYLGLRGFALSPAHSTRNEGYLSHEQARMFRERLKEMPHIQTIAEIGLNGGHSAQNFFRSCKGLKKFISFDLNQHPYVSPAVEFFTWRYSKQFSFIEGDSHVTIPQYSQQNPARKFDLIYIDGDHSYQGALLDILNCRQLATEKTQIWIDDYGYQVQRAVDGLQSIGVIRIKSVLQAQDEFGGRRWVEAEYLFP